MSTHPPLRLVTSTDIIREMRHNDVSLHALLPAYEDWLRSWGAAESTMRVRTSVLARVLVEVEPTAPALSAWLARYEEPWTRSAYYGHLRSFFGWAVEQGHAGADPTRAMKRPRTPKGVPRPLSEEEITRVFRVASGRTVAYMTMSLFAGLRTHEIAKFRGEDIRDGVIYVLGKGGKRAYIPLHPRIETVARSYPAQGWWFPSSHRPGTHLTPSAVSAAVTKVFAECRIEGSLHRLRHSYGTRLVRAGVSLRVVQELMRHDSLATTQGYIAVDDDERRRAILTLGAAA